MYEYFICIFLSSFQIRSLAQFPRHEARFQLDMQKAFGLYPTENFFRRGDECLPIPLLDHARVINMDDVLVMIPGPMDRIGRCDGDEAQLYVLNELVRFKDYCREHKGTALVIDVGALYGNTGLYTAKNGCRTVMFEPLIYYAAHIARTIQVNRLGHLATVRNEAVSFLSSLKPAAGTGHSVAVLVGTNGSNSHATAAAADFLEASRPAITGAVPGAVLDRMFADEQDILFLKVDVEGFEGVVLSTALELFRAGKVKHAVFEYSTSAEFQSRNGTDLDAFLPLLFQLGATKCFALHRKKPRIFEVLRGDAELFKQTLRAAQEQADVYCAFVPVTFTAPRWTPDTKLADGTVYEFIFGQPSKVTAWARARKDPRFARRNTHSSPCTAARPRRPSSDSSSETHFNLNKHGNKTTLRYKID